MIQIGLLLAYPLLAHIGIIYKQPPLLTAAIIFLAMGVFWNGMLARRLSSWLVVMCVTTVALLLNFLSSSVFMLYVPPVVVPLLLGWGFVRSLLPGQVPLVTEIGDRARGPLSESMQRYTRGVTVLWAVCLWAMASWALLIPIFGTLEMWSFFTNVVNQVVVAVVFVGEFIYRKYRFKDHDHPRFWEYLRIVFRAQHRREM